MKFVAEPERSQFPEPQDNATKRIVHDPVQVCNKSLSLNLIGNELTNKHS